ncbi:hypothetical protein [Treponema endosymbiont of Eucomonympha sp.]|uniref:hypothetical protein n=1 Tax=Treponema endosymbiont of Eucomonympha sp. TaxID=1580831 RepID=UPI00075121B7|nr:hypothetical protein [Treponema endosymbiont of Eucomonympha sp.]
MSGTRIADRTSGAGDAADLEVAIASWDYGPSVERSRVHLGEWKQKTIDFCRELYIARQALSRGLGGASRSDALAPTWTQYCADVGITRATANRWLSTFQPAELSGTGADVLLLGENGGASREDERLSSLRRIALFRESGVRPEDWTDGDERELSRQDAERRAERAAEGAYLNLKTYTSKLKPEFDYFSEVLSKTRDLKVLKLSNKALREIQDKAFDSVAAYLFSMPGAENQIRAAVNLCSKIKQFVNDKYVQLKTAPDSEPGAAQISDAETGSYREVQ